jgi:NAD(P)-dependent dehydrogenase (short-subunit alcohol dehydrogenase family)
MARREMTSFVQPIHAFVQGASRGLGKEFVRQLLEMDNVAKIIATCRRPQQALELQEMARNASGRLVVLGVDVTDEATIAEAARATATYLNGLHLVINAAGLLHDAQAGIHPEKKLDDLDPSAALRAFSVNALGPALVVKHLMPLLRHPDRAVIANISARVGSIEDNQLGGWYAYRASKAAQNMLTRTMAIELGRHRRLGEKICVALHPGTVDTDLSKPFQGNVPDHKLFSQERAVAQLLDVVDGLRREDSGKFFAWDGSPIPW